MSKFIKDRYREEYFWPACNLAQWVVDEKHCYFKMSTDPLDELEIYFEGFSEELTAENGLALVRNLSIQIQNLDNAVQSKMELDYRSAERDVRSYLYYIGYIVFKPSLLRLRYWGEGVNIEWEAEFNLQTDGVYVPSNF